MMGRSRHPRQGSNSALKLLLAPSNNISTQSLSHPREEEEEEGDSHEHEELLDDVITRLERESWLFVNAGAGIVTTPAPTMGNLDISLRPTAVVNAIASSSAPQDDADDADATDPELHHQEATIAELVDRHLDSWQLALIVMAAGLSCMSLVLECVATLFLSLQFEGKWHPAIVASSVFAGSVVGSILPTRCRRRAPRSIFCIATLIQPVVGCMTAIIMLKTIDNVDKRIILTAILRFLTGCLCACSRSIALSALNDYTPSHKKQQSQIQLTGFWTAGVILVTLIDSLTTPNPKTMLLWTQFLVLLAALGSICWLPESPSWLMAAGRVEDALLEIGNRCDPSTFDWCVAIQANAFPKDAPHDAIPWRLCGLWYTLGFLYYGATYLMNDMFHDSFEYYGTIVVSTELEVFGIFLAWYGISTHYERVIAWSSLLVGGTCVTLLAVVDRAEWVVVCAVFSRVGLMAALATSAAMATATSNEYSFSCLMLGGMSAPYCIDGGASRAVTGTWMAVQTVFSLLSVNSSFRSAHAEARTSFV